MRGAVSALILAGGKATRLGGVAKHELVPDDGDGRTIFERQVAVLAPPEPVLAPMETAPAMSA